MRRAFPLLLVVVLYAGCEGPVGPPGENGVAGEGGVSGDTGTTGPKGDPGVAGDAGAAGQNACSGPDGGQTAGLTASITVSAPANKEFFVVGERPLLTIAMADFCGHVLQPSQVTTANLYLYGPHAPLLTQTASGLLNCVVDRAAADDQHHFINLKAPSYLDPAHPNLSAGPDGTVLYQLAAISGEAPGTYTAGLWVENSSGLDQRFPLVNLQIGVATPETEVTGAGTASMCLNCHQAPSGVVYMHHIHPGHSAFGDYSLDSAPIADCKSCHNNDGYSVNPIVRKVHGIHRGSDQLAPGVAHPDYGLALDTTLASYLDVVYPSMPDKEKDCVSCHVDDRWETTVSRLACGTCHDNLFFNTGTLVPPREFGKPSSGNCAQDVDCAAFGNFATCDVATGSCERRTHPIELDDVQCAVCHTADPSGVSPIGLRHESYARTAIPGLAISNLTLTGGSGAGGSFLVGDVPTLTFQLADKTKAPVVDLISNAAYSVSTIIDGPTDDRQRLYNAPSLKASGVFSYDANGAVYKYVVASGLPASALAPLNTTVPFVRPNVAGTYTVWLWISDSLSQDGQSFRDNANATLDFAFGADGPIVPRQVISTAACDACHVVIQAHGGSRGGDASLCTACHTQGAVDRTVGSKGLPCTANAQCPGNSGGWEACEDTNDDGVLDACIITVDPTPNRPIEFVALVHDIHFARLLGGYSEANDLIEPGKLVYVGYNNGVTDLSHSLLPLDVRNCQKCHADTGAACSAQAPCGYGQQCSSAGLCINRSWVAPSARACLTCHDTGDATGHAALNTWQSPSGPVETCNVCHGETGDYAVEKVHDVTSPYVPPYQREP